MKIGLERNKKTLELNVVLLNKDGKASTEIAEIKKSKNSILGLVIEPLSAQEKSQLKLKMGVKIIKVEKGSIFTNKIQSGFILTHIDKSPIYSVNNAINILENKKGGILIEGKNKEGATEVIGVLIE
jgi:PDZ domain-containing secreted protein